MYALCTMLGMNTEGKMDFSNWTDSDLRRKIQATTQLSQLVSRRAEDEARLMQAELDRRATEDGEENSEA